MSLTSLASAQARVSASSATPSPYASVELSICGTPLYVLDEGLGPDHTAVRLGVGPIVLGSASDLARPAEIVAANDRRQVMLRVVPGIAAGGHAKIRTGTEDRKFGLSITDGSAQHAITRILAQPRLELVGLHCHIGSQISSVKPYVAAVRRMIGLMARVRDHHGLELGQLYIGGGHGIAYLPGEDRLDIGMPARRILAELKDGCAHAKLPVPRLTIEPGRSRDRGEVRDSWVTA